MTALKVWGSLVELHAAGDLIDAVQDLLLAMTNRCPSSTVPGT
jgi:hypothetical protein